MFLLHFAFLGVICVDIFKMKHSNTMANPHHAMTGADDAYSHSLY